ncbi:hypothetical protein MKW94_009795, partial [Papaver nudicaule]|nr:hypothetical protein [Papaver nudicaule]
LFLQRVMRKYQLLHVNLQNVPHYMTSLGVVPGTVLRCLISHPMLINVTMILIQRYSG